MQDIVFYEVFDEEEKALKRYMPASLKGLFVKETIQEHGKLYLPASLISIRTQSKIPTVWASQLKGIFTRSTGCEHLADYRRRTKTKALCGYLPGYCSRAVAEQAVLMLLALWRKLPIQIINFNRFTRDALTGQECQGKNLLVIGVGRIGSEIVDIGRGLGMLVKGVDIAPTRKDVEYVALSLGLEWADAAICAVPLTVKTRSLFNYSLLKKAKKGVVFINIARGEISPLKDLKRLLREGVLGGLGMDVYEDEADLAELLRKGKAANNRVVSIIQDLQRMDNVIFTPHNAFNTQQSLERKARQSIEAVEKFLGQRSFPDLVP